MKRISLNVLQTENAGDYRRIIINAMPCIIITCKIEFGGKLMMWNWKGQDAAGALEPEIELNESRLGGAGILL